MKATHSGHCQACGSLQKLPNGRLSLHGYKVTHGFFSGVCVGAKHEPFETSCALVQDFIARAKAHLDLVEADQAALRQPATDTTAWVHHFIGSQRGRSSYEWIQVALRVATDAEGRNSYFYTARKPRGLWTAQGWEQAEKQLTDYHYGHDTISEFVTALNVTRADWLEHEADSLRGYITWQTARVENWKPTALLPVDAKNDKAEFKPTEAKY